MLLSSSKFGRFPKPDDLVWVLVFIIGSLLISLFFSGCSTLYVMDKRREWRVERRNTSIYGDGDMYPALYRAIYINCAEEIPIWWKPYNGGKPAQSYISAFWFLGAPLSIIDLPISFVSDTVMIPYDAYWILNGQPNIQKESSDDIM